MFVGTYRRLIKCRYALAHIVHSKSLVHKMCFELCAKAFYDIAHICVLKSRACTWRANFIQKFKNRLTGILTNKWANPLDRMLFGRCIFPTNLFIEIKKKCVFSLQQKQFFFSNVQVTFHPNRILPNMSAKWVRPKKKKVWRKMFRWSGEPHK